VDWLYTQAIETKGMKISSNVPLTTKASLDDASVSFQFNAKSSGEADLYSPSYNAGDFVEVSEAAEKFPHGGKEGFLKFLIKLSSITPEESLRHDEGLNKIWARFQSMFLVFQGLSYYEPIFRTYCYRVLSQLHADGIRYADVRIAFLLNQRPRNEGEIKDYPHQMAILQDEIEKFKNSEEGKGFWGVRVIWTALRFQAQEEIMENMKQCVEIKKQFPELIAGYDVVGQEENGRTLHSMMPELLWFKQYCKSQSVDIPFFFHAGEVEGDGDQHDENLFDAILLGTKRIGHGFSMFKHPHLMEVLKKNKICLEVCPVSNEVLRLTTNIMSHPLPSFMAHGVPVSLSNDDPGLLGQGTAGMSHDFWQVLHAFENTGLEGMGDVAETSILYAAFDGEEIGVVTPGGLREKYMKEWRGEWELFCEWVVKEYEDVLKH